MNVELENDENGEFPLIDLGTNSSFLNFIKRDNVRKISSQEATLEEVFIKVTGKKLRE